MALYDAFKSGEIYAALWSNEELIFKGNAIAKFDSQSLYSSLTEKGLAPAVIEGNRDGFSGTTKYTQSIPVFRANEDEALVVSIGASSSSTNDVYLYTYRYSGPNTWNRLMYNDIPMSDILIKGWPDTLLFGTSYLNNRGYKNYSRIGWYRGDKVIELNNLSDGLASPSPPNSYKLYFPSFEWYSFDSDNPPVIPSDNDDPYNQGGTSGTGGGGGNFSDQSDNIGFSGVPDYDITTSGFVTAFAPTSAQLKSLANYMWNTLDLENWRKIFADPMDVITSLTLLPISPDKGSTAEVKVGNISTGVSMTTLAGQIKQIDCGTLAVQEYWGSYLDYDPYTKIQIYLPYIGFRPISTDQIMGKTVHVKYNVDCLSGNCVAQILCGEDLLYTFAGSMGYQVPFSATDWSSFISSTLTLAGSAIATVASGGASAPMTVPAIATSAVNMFKQNVDHSGTMAGNSGFLSDNYVYLAITRPRQALPKDQNKYSGYPSLVTSQLSELSGYTVVKEIHLENISCTGDELREMEGLLKSGVIL